MNNAILMSSGADNIDFMIHGIFSYEIFGHTVWITTSHVCILIVLLLMLGLAIAANRTMKHAKEIPEGFQNVLEIMVEKLDAMVYGTMGKVAAPKFVNYISTIFVFILMQYFRFVRVETADCRLRHNAGVRSHHICSHPYHAVQESAA